MKGVLVLLVLAVVVLSGSTLGGVIGNTNETLIKL